MPQDVAYEKGDSCIYQHITCILHKAREDVYKISNTQMLKTYWEIGKTISERQKEMKVEEEKQELVKALSRQMTHDFGKGYSVYQLNQMCRFYLTFPQYAQLNKQLTWSHYCRLLNVDNAQARLFYMQECAASNWSVRQLERQSATHFYGRLLASKHKDRVAAELAQKDASFFTPEDILRDPYVLEFLNLRQADDFYESDLEQALITHLQSFLLELGRGFSFVARQKRITLDGDHFYIDLVFYNYILKCFVLIDLKTTKLTHQDIGQMQMYVNYYTRELMNEGDQKPIGVILCADKSDSEVKYTLPEDNTQIYASQYHLYLPSEEEWKQELVEEMKVLEEQGIYLA